MNPEDLRHRSPAELHDALIEIDEWTIELPGRVPTVRGLSCPWQANEDDVPRTRLWWHRIGWQDAHPSRCARCARYAS